MPNRYTDPDGNTAEEVITWEVEQGYQGRWSVCKYFHDHGEAVSWVQQRRINCPQEDLRLVRVETTTVRIVEA